MKKLLKAVDKNSQLILDAEQYVWKHPETGYKEVETSKYMEKIFRDLGYELVKPGDIPGFYTTLDTGRPGPTLLVLGEMDSVICPQHKDSDPKTGAVHACGHNVQCAALIGVAAALKEQGVLDKLCGKIKLCAVPAEELLEIEYRTQLKEKGIIKYLGGKTEFLYRGYFDDVDLAFMVHVSESFSVGKGAVGFLAKRIVFKGKASHAGGSPWNGINALYAANCGLNAINAIRETFEEKDIVRVHPIIENGGTMVNAIPETVTMESYVRGSSFDGIIKNNQKVNRALCGAALSIGANININDLPGYAPLINDENLIETAKEAAKLTCPEIEFSVSDDFWSASTDMGELSCVMPVVHPFVAGIEGALHSADFSVKDPQTACVTGTKFQLGMIYILLSDNAAKAKKVVSEAKPPFSNKKEYFDFIDSFACAGDRIEYLDDFKVNVNIK